MDRKDATLTPLPMYGSINAMGLRNWEVRFKGYYPVSSIAVADGFIYFGREDHFLYCLDSNGKEVWKFETEDRIISSPAVSNGMVFFGCHDHKVYAVQAFSPFQKEWPMFRQNPKHSGNSTVFSD